MPELRPSEGCVELGRVEERAAGGRLRVLGAFVQTDGGHEKEYGLEMYSEGI